MSPPTLKPGRKLCLAALILTLASTTTAQPLPAGTLLAIAPGTTDAGGTSLLSGSGFGMEIAPGLVLWTAMGPGSDGGLILGVVQTASSSHPGPVDGSEIAPIDAPWEFFVNTGMHGTTLPVVDVGGSHLDMAGWYVTWNTIPEIPLGGDPANFPSDTGLATIILSGGSAYTLDYEAHVPLGDPSGFGGIRYLLHLEGTVSPSLPPAGDADGDGVSNGVDNCPTTPNPDQADTDGDGVGDGVGDACDKETCDGIDNNGNGLVDEGFPDSDGDGIADCVDPVFGTDADGDGFASIASGGTDCDDTNPAVHPGAIEIPGNGIDDNCDGLIDNTPPVLLPNGTLLTIDPGLLDPTGTMVASGSAFGMDVGGFILWTPIAPGSDGGIVLGTAQPALGSHMGPPDGSETAPIDAPWEFFGNTGMHGTSSPVIDLGGGLLDLSGWFVTWNGIPTIPLGGDPANFPDEAGVAMVAVAGTTYTLDYTAHVPLGDPSGFGGVPYFLFLTGSVIPPEPDTCGKVATHAEEVCGAKQVWRHGHPTRHGHYKKCVRRVVREQVRLGVIDKDCAKEILKGLRRHDKKEHHVHRHHRQVDND